MTRILDLEQWFRQQLNSIGQFIPLLAVRLLLAWEYWEAGLEKYSGQNWFSHIKENFPFPFSIIDVEISWFMATWFEILGSAGLLLGLVTRFWAFTLIIISIVAISGVHWPAEWSSLGELWEGYRITPKDGSGNYRVPLLFIAMLIPLVVAGAGKLSADSIVARRFLK